MASAENSKKPPARRQPRARTPEERERQLGGLAYDLAEIQLREGTAPAAVTLHFLKIVATREQLEVEQLRRKNNLLEKQAEQVVQADRIEAITEKAVRSMRTYQGFGDEEEY